MSKKYDKEDLKSSGPVKIEFKDGLNVRYNKDDLRKLYPHLMKEIEDEEDILNKDEVPFDIEKKKELKRIQTNKQQTPNELINPGATDFIRRCKNDEEAIEIIEYLLSRKEISQNEYDEFKKRINKKNGLKELIEECGGFKKPGYYEKKYYKKKINDQS